MSKRKGDFENNKSYRKKKSDSSESSKDSENIMKNEDDLENIEWDFEDNKGEKFVPSSLNLGLDKLNINAINKQKNSDYDDGYETEETVLDEDYVPPEDWVEPKSGYQIYLEDRKKRLEQYDPGYETDETVILDENGNYKKGGRILRLLKNISRKRKRVKRAKTFKKIIKKSHKKRQRNSKRKN